MRSLLVTVLLLLVLAAALTIAWSMGGGSVPSPLAPSSSSDSSAATGGSSSPREIGDGPAKPVPAGTVATRTVAQPASTAADLADRPTAWLRIVDHDGDEPLTGAIVRRFQDAAELSFSDERGLAALPLKKATQLVVIIDGYLLRLAPTQLGSTEADPQVVRMVRDVWSMRRQFAFVDPAGDPVAEAFVRLRPMDEGQTVHSPVPDGDVVRRRAWSEHVRMAEHAVSEDVAVQIGRYNEDRVHRLASNGTVRFLAPGDFELEAATVRGLVGRATVHVAAGPQPPAQRVSMVPGVFVDGVVEDLAGKRLAGVEVTVQGGEPLGLVATSDASGGFSIGPLAATAVTLLVRSGRHQPIAHGPLQAPADDVRIRLAALASSVLRGRVRSRPSLEPISGATVIWKTSARGEASTATTGVDGTFELQARGDVAARLIVQAPGYVTYAELVDPGAVFADYDLLPADTATRLAAGLTATLEGIVVDPQGQPAAEVAVRWRPDRPAASSGGLPMRRTLEGATLELPPVTTTDRSGAFVLETTRFGPGRLTLVDDATKGIDAVAVAGKTVNGLRLDK